jgi:hypothetical protein
MRIKNLAPSAIFLILVVLLAISVPSPVAADGGPIVPHDLWAELEEGHQIGVVTILGEDRARIDLFISILDATSVSHQITFFVPIGKNTADFQALEQDLFTFDERTTKWIDNALRDGASNRQETLQALFAGALLNNGAILIPAWAPLMLTGCGAASQKPEQVLTTESSEISIYGIDDNTDLNDLVQTSGLPDNVIGTLSRLKGQQIAIVKLNTKPASTLTQESTGPGQPAASEPGLHLSWTTEAITSDSGRTITYPLGTGDAWAKPIKLTRVYINANSEMDFSVQYPKLGAEHSGYDFISGSNIQPFTDSPAYAVDEARGSYGHVWRATYTQSNATSDVVITVKTAAYMEEHSFGYSLLFAFIIGILIWMFAWHYLMPVFLGKETIRKPGWWESLIYPGINFVFAIFPGAIFWLIFVMGLAAPALIIQFLVGVGVSIGFFMLIHSKRMGVSRGRALSAFVLTSLCGSAAYLILAVGFGFLVNAI